MTGGRHTVDDAERAYEGRRVCITGGAGFIGARLVETLLDLGAHPTIIDDLSNSSTERIGDIVDRDPERVQFIHGSILDPDALAEAVQGTELVFHLAAVSAVGSAAEDPRRAFDVNVAGAVRVAETARLAGVERLVYSGSSSAYGAAAPPHTEQLAPRPLSVYAASKLAAEHVVTAWAESRGLPCVTLRLFNVYGAGQPEDSAESAVIPAFISRLRAGEAPVIFGNGLQTRDFVHVDDAVRAFLLAGASERAMDGGAVNIGTGRPTTLLDLVEALKKLLNSEAPLPVHEEPRSGDVPHSHADISRARDLLGFEPAISLEDGLARTLGLTGDASSTGARRS
ncbi:MAG: NAD-dependent epimerase/dehydratase family protein [Phycisphaeraceae bacterium]|nr:MAG: NAD-dependent epimerase/dehydratase family protein [Phycisphaeraceae bacterium]